MATETAEDEVGGRRLRPQRKLRPRKKNKIAKLQTSAATHRRKARTARRRRLFGANYHFNKAGSADAKRKYLEALNQRTTWNLPGVYITNTILKWTFGFIFCLEFGVLAVSGVYDLVLETEVPLKVYGGLIVVIGAAFLILGAIFFRHNRQNDRGTASAVAAMIAGVIILAFSAGVFYTAFVVSVRHPWVQTQTDAYHYWVESAQVRHLFYRKEPEGLVAGLMSVFWTWCCAVRAAKDYKYYYGPLRGWFSTPGDNRDAETWKFMVVPFLAIAFAIGTQLLLWYWLLYRHNDQSVSNWLRSWIPVHVSMIPAASQTGLVDTFVASVTVAWPAFIIGFVSSRFWGRAPAGGPINDAVKVMSWSRIQSKGQLESGDGLKGALRWWQSRQQQGTIIEEFTTGESWTHPDDESVHGTVAYAQYQLSLVGKGPLFLIRTIQMSLPFLVIVGFIYVYIIARGK
jgi:hypothetical protein